MLIPEAVPKARRLMGDRTTIPLRLIGQEGIAADFNLKVESNDTVGVPLRKRVDIQ